MPMLQHQVDDMRNACSRIALRRRPPVVVRILTEQATFLGVKCLEPAEPRNPDYKKWTPPGTQVGPFSRVRFSDLYVATRNAVGVNHPDYQAGREVQTSDPDHSEEHPPSEGGAGD